MKKILVSAVIIVAFVGYFWFQQQSQAGVDIIPSVSPTPSRTPIPTSNPTTLPVATGTPNPTVVPTSVPTQQPTPKPVGLYKDGTYTSQVADAGYGPVQIRVTVSGGKMTNVQFLQYPTDAGHSRQVSSYSTPILSQEAIQGQTANVDTVSGATSTSEAFIQALAGVLSSIRT